MYEHVFTIVLFGCELGDSKTLTSLIQSRIDFPGIHLVIWNNGPRTLKELDVLCEIDGKITFTFTETIHNESLAIIYNRIIGEYPSKFYTFLDHDSELGREYLTNLLTHRLCGIRIPTIFASGKAVSPFVKKRYKNGGFIRDELIAAIGSGLTVSEDIAEKLSEKYGSVFDERFYLYGVDTTFFIRVRDSGLNQCVSVEGRFNHDLSRKKKESKEVKKMRRVERAYDVGLRLKFYSDSIFQTILVIAKCFIDRLLSRNGVSIVHLLIAYRKGNHFRAQQKLLGEDA